VPLATKVGLDPGHIVLEGDPAPHRKGAQPLNFRPVSVLAKRSPISATAEHLLSPAFRRPCDDWRTTESSCRKMYGVIALCGRRLFIYQISLPTTAITQHWSSLTKLWHMPASTPVSVNCSWRRRPLHCSDINLNSNMDSSSYWG